MSIVLPESSTPTNPAFLYATWAAAASVTASSSDTGTTPSDILAATHDTGHRFTGAGDNSYTIDAGLAIAADCLALAGSAFAGLSVTLEGSADNSTWETVTTATLGSDSQAAWLRFDSSTWRYWRLTFAAAPSNMEINHLCLATLEPWPYFEEDYDPENIKVDGTQLVSAGGYYGGGVVQSALRSFSITPGMVSAQELEPIADFAANVIRYQRGCFFVPQISGSVIYFGWLDDKDFSAPNQKNGLYAVRAMTFMTRAD